MEEPSPRTARYGEFSKLCSIVIVGLTKGGEAGVAAASRSRALPPLPASSGSGAASIRPVPPLPPSLAGDLGGPRLVLSEHDGAPGIPRACHVAASRGVAAAPRPQPRPPGGEVRAGSGPALP